MAGHSYTASASTYTWNVWCSSTSATLSSSSDNVWYGWTDGDTSATSSTTYTAIWYTWTNTESQEQAEKRRSEQARAQAERERQEQERIRRYEEQEQKREAAEKKAKELLLDLIGPEEMKVYERTGRLFVRGKKHDYIVQKSGYVKQIKKDIVTDLCVHLKDRNKFPDTDNVVALKLAIEAEEDNVIKMANDHGSRPIAQCPELREAACQ